MRKIIIYITLIFTTIFISCENEIDLDLDQSAQRLVIQGNVSNNDTSVAVLITKTGGLNQESDYETVNTAEVRLKYDGITLDIPSTGSGNYNYVGLIPELGKEYNLEVMIDGKTYKANTTFPSEIEANALTPEVDFVDPFVELQNSIKCKKGSNYLWYLSGKNGVPDPNYYLYVSPYFIENDGDSVIKTTSFYISFDGNLSVGDTITSFYRNIDAVTYDYFSELIEASYQDIGNLNPFNAKGNFDDVSVLGYFGSYYQSEAETVIK